MADLLYKLKLQAPRLEEFAPAPANSIASTVLELTRAASLPLESAQAKVRARLQPDDLAGHVPTHARVFGR